MAKIYTKKGDKGETDLSSGGRVKKTFSLIHALGDVDELNSFVGLSRSYLEEHLGIGDTVGIFGHGLSDEDYNLAQKFLAILRQIQRDLFRIGADLAGVSKDKSSIGKKDVEFLEVSIDTLPCEVSWFVPPGAKGELSARLHICRSVCRRAERSAIAAFDEIGEGKLANISVEASPFVLQYLNRLSDLFFAMAEC